MNSKYHVIKKLTHFVGSKSVDSFHYVMYHGLAEREGRGDAAVNPPKICGKYVDRLLLTINVFRPSLMFQPHLNLVVAEEVRHKLASLPDVDFLEARVDKAFYIPYTESSFTHWNDPKYKDDGSGPERVIDRQSHRQDLLDQLQPLFEVIPPKYAEVRDLFSDTLPVSLALGPTKFSRPFLAELSIKMLHLYPMMRHFGCHILSDAAFKLLAPYVNWHYFLHAESTL